MRDQHRSQALADERGSSSDRGAPGRWIRQAADSGAYIAFVPDPLPPRLAFTPDLVSAVNEAAAATGELAGLGRALPNPYLIIRPFIRREAVASSQIEGTETDLDQLYVYEAGQRMLPGIEADPADSEVREVHNYVRALDSSLRRLEDLPVSLRLVREVHGHLMHGVRGNQAAPGEFRRSQNWIGPPGCGASGATYVPPPVPEMRNALDGLELYLHAEPEYPPLVRLALIHYQFEAIHPFLDGNGRVGRLLLILLAVHWGLLPSPLLYLSPFFERQRQRYYDLLLGVTPEGAWEGWVHFFLRGVATQARDALHRARRLLDLQAALRERVTATRASASLLRLVDRLFEAPVISVPQAREVLGLTYRGAQLNVAKLVEHGILHQLGTNSYGKLYAAPEILGVLREEGASGDE